jgi:hypothetical protein
MRPAEEARDNARFLFLYLPRLMWVLRAVEKFMTPLFHWPPFPIEFLCDVSYVLVRAA